MQEVVILKKEKELLEAFGWEEKKSPNPWMKSWVKDVDGNKFRINFYYTTRTVTVQGDGGSCDTYREVDILKLEDIIQNI